MISTEENEILQNFDSRIRPYIECLLLEKNKIILTDENFKIINPFSGLISDNSGNVKYDRFKLKIPYAQQTLIWEIIFDVTNAKEPPDFIFDSYDEDFYPPLEKIHSLVCWNWERRDSLVAIIKELLDFYKEYQLQRIEQNTVMQRHFTSFLKFHPESLQVKVNKIERGLGVIDVLCKVDLDFSNLPPYPSEQINPGPDAAVLHVHFPRPNSTNIKSELFLSPAVEKALGGQNTMRIPTFHNSLLLGDYFENIKQMLKKQIDIVTESLKKRKDYIAALHVQFGGSVQEYDSKNYSKIIFLFEWNDFFFSFTIDIPSNFPLMSPCYTIRSVYHHHNGQPYVEKHNEIPWSPRWSSLESAKRASDFILDHIKEFQRTSVNNSDK